MSELADPEEEWRPVVGWEGYYEVSSLGRVRNVASGPGRRVGHILKTHAGRYVQVGLCRGGNPQTHYVHRLVCEAFNGPPPSPETTDVLHWDDNPANNTPGNLRWGTVSDNLRDAVRNGGYRNQNTGKERCIRGHVLPETRKCLQCVRDSRSTRMREGLPPNDPRHGTITGYTSWGCKCDRCKEAQRRYDGTREFRSRKE